MLAARGLCGRGAKRKTGLKCDTRGGYKERHRESGQKQDFWHRGGLPLQRDWDVNVVAKDLVWWDHFTPVSATRLKKHG